MYGHIRRKLTLLSGTTITILFLIMTIGYLQISETNILNNRTTTIMNDISTLATTIELESTISNTLLSNLEQQGNYLISSYTNAEASLYDSISKTTAQREVMNTYWTYYQNHAKEFTYHNLNYRTQFVYFKIPNSDYPYESFAITFESHESLVIILLASSETLNAEIHHQRITLLPLCGCIILLLWLFLWFFNGKILDPVEKSRKEQVQFVAAASHELRTPLAVILSCVEAMDDLLIHRKVQTRMQQTTDGNDDFYAELNNYTSISKRESMRMAKLLEDLLTLSSSDANHFTLELENVDLDTLVLNTYEAFEVMTTEKKQKLSITLPEASIPVCHCDKSRITQVLAILINNAISYTPVGGKIELALSREKDKFHITVTDSGMGIDDEDKKNIFKRFYRSEKSRSTKGHFGLGLAIAYEIIKAHKGDIYVTDAKEGGAVFHVVLPVS